MFEKLPAMVDDEGEKHKYGCYLTSPLWTPSGLIAMKVRSI